MGERCGGTAVCTPRLTYSNIVSEMQSASTFPITHVQSLWLPRLYFQRVVSYIQPYHLFGVCKLKQSWTGDGKNLMKPDLTHVAYPIGDPIRGHCPATHPKRFLTLSYEFQFETQIFPYRKNGFVFSFGDATGLGFHGMSCICGLSTFSNWGI